MHRGDGIAMLKQLAPASMDAAFLDPPFDSDLLEGALRAAAVALKPAGCVYMEAPSTWSNEQLAPFGLTVFRHLKAGAAHAHLLKRIRSRNA